jgi:hypothetical protein
MHLKNNLSLLSFLTSLFLLVGAFLLFLFDAVLLMLFDENLIELLLAVFASNVDYLLVLKIIINIGFLLLVLLLFLLNRIDCSSEVFRCGLPVVPSLCLVEALALRHAHLLLFFQLILLYESGLNWRLFTCYLEVIRFAYELNSLRLDMNTSLHAFACFSKALRLNLRPQPSGHSTRSFSLSGGSDSSSYCSRMGFSSCATIFCYYFF